MFRRRRRSRAFLISFAVTALALTSLAVFSYLSKPAIQVNHLPASLPPYSTAWGHYVPADALYVGFENLTLAHSVNSSIPAPQPLFEILGPRVYLRSTDLDAILTIAYSSPNATADIAFLKPTAFANFSLAISGGGNPRAQVGTALLYFVANRVGNQTSAGWMALVPQDNVVALAEGTASAKAALTESLDVQAGTASSILSSSDVDRLLYIVGGAGGHEAIAIQNFPGVVRSGEMTLVSVDYVGGYAQVSYVVKFADEKQAESQLDAVTSAYLSAHDVAVYDAYVRATALQPGSSLEEAMRLVL